MFTFSFYKLKYMGESGVCHCDTPPNSLIDSILNPKVKTTEG